MTTSGSRWAKLVLFFLGVVLLVNQLTPRPFVTVFRALTGLMGETVSIGPYAGQISTVRRSERLAIPVAYLISDPASRTAPSRSLG